MIAAAAVDHRAQRVISTPVLRFSYNCPAGEDALEFERFLL